MTNKLVRESNIELLRIFSIIGVIVLHYNHWQMGGAFNFASENNVNLAVLYFMESICIIGVNVFVLISGYFLVNLKKRDLWKPITLLFQVIAFQVALYMFSIVLHNTPFSFLKFIRALMPTNYFVILYTALFLVSPFINIVIENLTYQGRKKFLLVIFLLFSVWPTLVDMLIAIHGKDIMGFSTISLYGSQYGYTIVQFMMMYAIGACVKLGGDERSLAQQKINYSFFCKCYYYNGSCLVML